MNLRSAFALGLLLLATAAQALGPEDGGTFVALDQDGEPAQKIFRATQRNGKWTFEDRQPDGSWLDVSCHGGCEHIESSAEDMLAFFGGPPPPNIEPECVHNTQFAFCRFLTETQDRELHGYVLVVRVEGEWYPINLLRLPDPEQDAPPASPPLESAGWTGHTRESRS